MLDQTAVIPKEAEMSKSRLLVIISFGLLIFLSSCQAAGQPLTAALYKPGDTLSGMSLATGAADAAPLWAFCSSSQQGSFQMTFDCRAPLLPTLAIGNIFLPADELLANLNWSDLAWELSIDGQPVDLESFGTFDYAMPGMAPSPSPVREVFMRATAWNIVLTNLSPGEHTLRFAAQTENDSYLWLVNLVIEPVDTTEISAAPFPPKS